MKILNKFKLLWSMLVFSLFLQSNVCFGGLYGTPLMVAFIGTHDPYKCNSLEMLRKAIFLPAGYKKAYISIHIIQTEAFFAIYPVMIHDGAIHLPEMPNHIPNDAVIHNEILRHMKDPTSWFMLNLQGTELERLPEQDMKQLNLLLQQAIPNLAMKPTALDEQMNWYKSLLQQVIETEKKLQQEPEVFDVYFKDIEILDDLQKARQALQEADKALKKEIFGRENETNSPLVLFQKTLQSASALLNPLNNDSIAPKKISTLKKQLQHQIIVLESLKNTPYSDTPTFIETQYILEKIREGRDVYDRLKIRLEELRNPNTHLHAPISQTHASEPNADIPLETAAPLPQILPPVSESAANAPITPSESTLNHSKRRRPSKKSRNNRHMAPKPTTPVTTADETGPIPQTATPLPEAEPVLAPEDSVSTPTSASIPETAAAIDVPEAAKPLPQLLLQPDPYAMALDNSDGLTDEDIKEWQTALRTHQKYTNELTRLEQKQQDALAKESERFTPSKGKRLPSEYWKTQISSIQQTIDSHIQQHGIPERIAMKIVNRKSWLAAQRRKNEKEKQKNLPTHTQEIADMSPEEFDSRLQNSFPEAFRPLPTIPPIDNGLADHPPVIDAAAPPARLAHLMPGESEESRTTGETTSGSLETVD